MAPLTFGVEFEFIVATIPPNGTDPDQTDPRPVKNLDLVEPRSPMPTLIIHRSANNSLRRSIAAALESAGLPCYVDCDSPPDSPRWEVGDDNSLSPPRGLDSESYIWYTVETKSPPLYFCRESLEAVRLVCETLSKSFRINVNDSCGLHVHVGDGINGFDLQTLKNLAAFFWVFEPVLDKLHPPDRRNGGYSRSIREASKLATLHRLSQSPRSRQRGKHQADEPIMPSLEAIQYIYATRSINELVGLIMNPLSPWMAVNLNHQRRPFHDFMGVKRTVEFRMHTGTIDVERVLTWIKTVVGIMEMVRESEEADFLELLMEGARREGEVGEEMGVVELMKNIGLDGEASYYDKTGVYD